MTRSWSQASGRCITATATAIATATYRTDLGTGLVIRTATPNLPERVTFLAGQRWVLVKSRSTTGQSAVIE